jgi:hypothetical protein
LNDDPAAGLENVIEPAEAAIGARTRAATSAVAISNGIGFIDVTG